MWAHAVLLSYTLRLMIDARSVFNRGGQETYGCFTSLVMVSVKVAAAQLLPQHLHRNTDLSATKNQLNCNCDSAIKVN